MVEFIQVHDTTDKHFMKGVKIYVDAFPPNERHSEPSIRERVNKGLSRLRLGLMNGEVVFMALLWPLKDTDFIVLDYMATKPSHRGQGIATAFMQQMGTELREKKMSFIFEVEDERQGQNIAERKKRKSFYRKNSAKELKDVRYILPPLQGADLTDMSLMIFPDYGFKTIGIEEVKSLIVQMYRELYGRDRNDPFLNSFINDLKDPIEIV